MINIVHAWNFMYENDHSYELLLFMYDILDHGNERLLIMDDKYWLCIMSWPLPLGYLMGESKYNSSVYGWAGHTSGGGIVSNVSGIG